MKTYRILFLLTFSILFAGQIKAQEITGTVSFITSENVYVRFTDASKIEAGDTLNIVANGISTPCLLVVNKSSTSCVTKAISGCNPEKGAEITARIPVEKKKRKEEVAVIEDELAKDKKGKENAETAVIDVNDSTENTDAAKKSALQKFDDNFNGRFSLANYTTNDANGTKNRIMARLALDADHIAESNWNFESYVNFTQLATNRSVPTDFKSQYFNVYNLALGYEKDSSHSIYIGRRINNKMASVGATDGIQAEKQFGNLSIGALAGFRPGVFNYSLDLNLPQFGAYLAWAQKIKSWQSQTTLGFIEQKNSGATDRRYAYLQHSSSFKKLFVFGSAQVDLYQKLNGAAQSDFKLTGLYASARYRFNKKLSVTASFDTRKNLIFYESYASNLSFLLDNNPTRQGVRLRLNYRLSNYISAGASYNTRMQSDNKNTFNNYSFYARHAKLPGIGGSMYLSHNRSASNAVNYASTSANYNKNLLDNKMAFEAYYRLVNYQYTTSDFTLPNQHYVGMGFNFNLAKKLTFSVLGERSQRQTFATNRLNLKLSQRF